MRPDRHSRRGLTFGAEEIHAYVDGELPPERAEELRLAARRDPELNRRIEALADLNARLRSHFEGPETEPLPDHMRALLERWRKD